MFYCRLHFFTSPRRLLKGHVILSLLPVVTGTETSTSAHYPHAHKILDQQSYQVSFNYRYCQVIVIRWLQSTLFPYSFIHSNFLWFVQLRYSFICCSFTGFWPTVRLLYQFWSFLAMQFSADLNSSSHVPFFHYSFLILWRPLQELQIKLVSSSPTRSFAFFSFLIYHVSLFVFCLFSFCGPPE